MRIIGGDLKGRTLHPNVSSWPTRPTTDYAKEALFNILSNAWDFEDLRVLDLYAGTGNISFEFLSRGVKNVVAVESFGKAVQFLSQTAKLLNVAERMEIIKGDVLQYLKNSKDTFHIIFADPPYDSPWLSKLPETILQRQFLGSEGSLIIEHDKRIDFHQHPNFSDFRQYGGCCFTFFDPLG
jgi:16S rRNA (guanine966-N2)-methyltransferase